MESATTTPETTQNKRTAEITKWQKVKRWLSSNWNKVANVIANVTIRCIDLGLEHCFNF